MCKSVDPWPDRIYQGVILGQSTSAKQTRQIASQYTAGLERFISTGTFLKGKLAPRTKTSYAKLYHFLLVWSIMSWSLSVSELKSACPNGAQIVGIIKSQNDHPPEQAPKQQ